MSQLFTPLRLREVEFRNRVFLSPMCQYSSPGGLATDWHRIHYGARAAGGVGLMMVEATAVVAQGQITPFDMGLWSERHAQALAPIARFAKQMGAVPGIQLAHAGRKASCDVPWRGGGPLPVGQGAWEVVAPSPLPFAPNSAVPRELSEEELDALLESYEDSARLALEAGFQVLELHMAHGYLLHEFLSPLSNRRTDEYGGSWENRARFPLRVATALRGLWPERWPVFVRISATDWVEGGWDLAQSVQLAGALKELGIDLVDCSSGGLVPEQRPPEGPGFQVPFAAAVRREAGIATGAVGRITSPVQAEQIVVTGQADVVSLAREHLRYPHWALLAARELGAEGSWPNQYLRGRPPLAE